MPDPQRPKPRQPMAEIFGFPMHSTSEEAARYRKHRLCPFNNRVPNCTKDKAESPLGVCSVFTASGDIAITCPVRFREHWLIASDAADFFFPPDARFTSLTEVRLNDANGQSAGNIDVVLVVHDEQGRITDYGSLEVQGVYISGNIRKPFDHFTATGDTAMDWTSARDFPRPDFLSSSRKRLVPQLLYKGEILNHWGRKIAVALDRTFYETLPGLAEVPKAEAEMAWLIYELKPTSDKQRLALAHYRSVFTRFQDSLRAITTPAIGDEKVFLRRLQTDLDKQLKNQNGTSPDVPGIIASPFDSIGGEDADSSL